MLPMPFPQESEHELVAAVFVDHRVLDDVADLVSADDFHNSILRTMWEALNQVVSRDGALDLPLFREHLKQRGMWDRVGGDNTINRLLDRGGSTSRVTLYAREVRAFARRRAVIAAADEISHKGKMPVDDVDAYCMEAEDAIRSAAIGRSSHQFLTPQQSVAAVNRLATEETDKMTSRCIPSGFPSFDQNFTFGGLPRKLVVLAARPKMGKTNLGLQFALTMAQAGHPGVIFSIEMTHEEVTARMQSNLSGVSSRKAMGEVPLTGYDLDVFLAAGEKLSALPYRIDDSGSLTGNQVRSRCGRAERELGAPLQWCVVDYFNLMDHPYSGKHTRSDEAMGVTSKALANLAKERNMAVLLLAQLNRKVEDKPSRIPEMHHLRECGSLEQDAAMVISPFWPHYYFRNEPKNEAKLLILANRFGATGEIKLRFDPASHRYSEVEDPLYG